MVSKATRTHVQVQSTDGPYQKDLSRSGEDFPFEVITLLNVCARIEARRQAKLHGQQKEVC
jgi:hypothetical protein